MSITFEPQHPTFVAECKGVDFSQALSDETIQTIKDGIAKYGVLIFRSTGLDNERHIAFGRKLGELDDVTPYNTLGRKNRLAPHDELFDVSNLDENGELAPPTGTRAIFGKANALFHTDSSFNARRAGLSLLLAHEVPPNNVYGEIGNTEFADSRTAYTDLPEEMKEKIKDFVVGHTQLHSRRRGAPNEPLVWEDRFDPAKGPISRHSLVQIHERSGRPTMYIGAHCYRIEGLPVEEGQAIIDDLLKFSSQPKYVYSASWKQPGDLIMWDNTAVQHRAVQGPVDGKFRRDMRRVTVHDDSKLCRGLNGADANWRVGLP